MRRQPAARRGHRTPFGAERRDDGTTRFRLWAPAARSVELWLADKRRSEVTGAFPEGYVLRHTVNLGSGAAMHEGPTSRWGRPTDAVGSLPAAWTELAPWTVRWYFSEAWP